MCCDSWGHKELDTTERLNLTELNNVGFFFSNYLSIKHPDLNI